MNYNKKDYYHQKAKQEGYFARSAYKLKEMQKKYNLYQAASNVLDLGCAPGAWSQVVLERLSKQGSLIGIDLEKVDFRHKKAEFIQADIFDFDFSKLDAFDCILSDMAPKTSGIRFRDQARSFELCNQVIELSDTILKPKGNLVTKFFECQEMQELSTSIKAKFERLARFRPQSTRTASIEIYLIGLNKK